MAHLRLSLELLAAVTAGRLPAAAFTSYQESRLQVRPPEPAGQPRLSCALVVSAHSRAEG